VNKPGISRRGALIAGLGVAASGAVAATGYGLVEAGTVPGKYRLARLLGACGSPPPAPRGDLPVRHETQFWSAYRQRRVSMVALLPAGVRSLGNLGVVIALHGLGGDAAGTASALALAMASPQIPRSAASRFAVITVDGGATYWHRRADGDDPQGMIIHEVLPRAAALGLRTSRIGIVGDSMGGYGALLLAERLATAQAPKRTAAEGTASGGSGASRVGAVAAISPAIFASYANARRADPRSFDGAANFAANDVFAQLAALRHVPAYIACGSDDPFAPTAALFRARLRRLTGAPVAGSVTPGCHDYAFWARNLPPGLTFLSAHLA
jgi:S-formylglutathione hydrolase FrmB